MAFSPLTWLAVGIVIMALEIVMPGFIIFWFGLGGVITALLVFIGIVPIESAEYQWLVFFLSSFALLGAWQFYFRKRFFKGKLSDESRDATLTNLKGKVSRKILPGIPGEVELYTLFHGIKIWQAESADAIDEGEEIVVVEADGIKLIVRKQ